METCSVVPTFEFVNEILWCDHSNETSSQVLLHGTICCFEFYKMEFGIFPKFCYLAIMELKVQRKPKVYKSYQPLDSIARRGSDTLLRIIQRKFHTYVFCYD